MNTLNLGSDETPATKKKSNTRNLKIALGLAAVILVPTIGSTLAGSITINTNTNVEFGQGLAQTAACDPDGITLTPASTFDNATGTTGIFELGTIVISGIANACTGKDFKITAYGDTDDVLVALSENDPATVGFTPTISAASSGSCSAAEEIAFDGTAVCGAYYLDNNTVTISLLTPVDAADIFKFTVETA